MQVVVRLAQIAASAVLGAAIGIAAVALHQWWWGLLLGLVTAAALLVALPAGWCRLPFAVAYAALMIVLTALSPGGDFVIASDAPGYIVMISAMAVLGFGFSGIRPPRRGPEPPVA